MKSKSTRLTKKQMQSLKEFTKELENYTPDWPCIIVANQSKTMNEWKDYEEKLKTFGKRVNELRKCRKLSLRTLGELCDTTHTTLYKIENNKYKKMPFELLNKLADIFCVPTAYLVGLTGEPYIQPTLIDEYFWENPESKYLSIREIAAKRYKEQGNQDMITVYNTPLKTLEEKLLELIHNDIKLTDTIYTLLSAPENKRHNYIKILEYLCEL